MSNMKHVAMMVIACAITVLVGCTSRSGQLLAGTKKMRVHPLKMNSATQQPISISPVVMVKNVDSLYHSGDTVMLGNALYVIE